MWRRSSVDETVARLLDTALIVALTLAWVVERRRRRAAEHTIAILADQVNRYEDHLGRPIGRIISSRLDADGTVEVEAMVDATAVQHEVVSVEAVREAAHWLERSQREQNVHQFRHGMALLRAALAGPTPSPAVERRGRLSHGGGQHHPGQHPRGAGSSMHDVGGPHVLDLLNEAARPGQSFSFQIPTTDFTKDG